MSAELFVCTENKNGKCHTASSTAVKPYEEISFKKLIFNFIKLFWAVTCLASKSSTSFLEHFTLNSSSNHKQTY